jgi:alkaline phosphatase
MRFSLTLAASLSALAFAACGGSSNSHDDEAAQAAATPKNVIFFLGDGFGMVPMTAARIYAAGEDGELTIDTFPETAFVKTYSNDAQVTDSAPSMSAYMTGVKMNNEVISMSSGTLAADAAGKAYINGADSTCPASGNGTPVTTLLELAKSAQRATGVVTTTRVTHATPAATYAHVCHRDGENTIAAQLVPEGAGYNAKLLDGVDVVLGGGWQHFAKKGATIGSSRTDDRDLLAELQARGYTTVLDKASFDAVDVSKTKRLIGLFTKGHMNFDIDRDAAKEPSLAEMTTKAIDTLRASPSNKKGFFLMVEGGRIDQALHPTLGRKALQDAKAFDDAIAAAIAKVKAFDPNLSNTLIVVTADHDHTLVLNGYAARTGKTTATNPGILGLMRDYADPSKPAVDADGMPFTTLVFGNGENRVNTSRALMTPLTDDMVFDKNYHQEAAVQMPTGSETHGGADVFLGAMGLGADQFHGVMDNTRVFTLVKTAVGL